MKRVFSYAAIALCAPILLSTAATGANAAAARNYDCTKPGNANKAACKSAAPATAATAKSAPVTTTTTKAAPAANTPAAAKPRNYDCSKAGNANKAACKSLAPTASSKPAPEVTAPAARTGAARPTQAAAPAAQTYAPTQQSRPAAASAGRSRIVEWTTKTGKVVHYDCSKAGNFNKQACKQ